MGYGCVYTRKGLPSFYLDFTVVVSLSVSLLRLVVADRVCGLFFSYVL